MRLQTDNEFQQAKIKDLNDKHNKPCLQNMFEMGNSSLWNKKLENLINEYQKLKQFLIKQKQTYHQRQ